MAKYDSEKETVKTIKKEKPWYTSASWATLSIIVLAVIDTAGFTQGVIAARENLKTEYTPHSVVLQNTIAMGIMICAFIVAFEIATLYMAYAFSLKLYQYDRQALKRIRNRTEKTKLSSLISTTSLGWISFGAFILGIIANTLFRLGLMEGKSFFHGNQITVDGAITIVMIILPVITSIINFVIGCFAFDPLIFEMNYLAKKISKAQSAINDLEAEKAQRNALIESAKKALEDIELAYECSCDEVDGLYPCIITRVYEQEIRDA